VGQVLNLGSSCIYPREAPNPLREDQLLTGPLEPTNEGYALGKIIAMKLCEYINRQHPGRAYKTMIPCNLYGRHDHYEGQGSHMVPAVIRKMHDAREAGAPTVELWGDGSARREFMYAGDLADAMVRAIGAFDTVPDVMNIGLGHDYSVLDYYHAVAKVVGWQGEFRFDLTKPTGMQQKLVDVTRQTQWGWQPAHSLVDGLAASYAYFLQESRS
jgi:GDP-L-fucose synthase